MKAAREEYVALHMEDPARAAKMVSSLPKLDQTNTSLEPPAPKEGEAALSTDQSAIAKMLGIDPAAMARNLGEAL